MQLTTYSYIRQVFMPDQPKNAVMKLGKINCIGILFYQKQKLSALYIHCSCWLHPVPQLNTIVIFSINAYTETNVSIDLWVFNQFSKQKKKATLPVTAKILFKNYSKNSKMVTSVNRNTCSSQCHIMQRTQNNIKHFIPWCPQSSCKFKTKQIISD